METTNYGISQWALEVAVLALKALIIQIPRHVVHDFGPQTPILHP